MKLLLTLTMSVIWAVSQFSTGGLQPLKDVVAKKNVYSKVVKRDVPSFNRTKCVHR